MHNRSLDIVRLRVQGPLGLFVVVVLGKAPGGSFPFGCWLVEVIHYANTIGIPEVELNTSCSTHCSESLAMTEKQKYEDYS